MQHRGMQRLVQIGPRHRDVILESPRHRPPHLVDHTQRLITVVRRVGNHADRQQVINLIERALLPLNLLVNGVKPLHASFDLRGNPVLHQLFANGRLHFVQKFLDCLAA